MPMYVGSMRKGKHLGQPTPLGSNRKSTGGDTGYGKNGALKTGASNPGLSSKRGAYIKQGNVNKQKDLP